MCRSLTKADREPSSTASDPRWLEEGVAIGRKPSQDGERVAPGGAKRPVDTITARVIVASPSLANVKIMSPAIARNIVHPTYSCAHDRNPGIGPGDMV